MAQSSFAILVKFDRHFGAGELQPRRFQNHLARIFPALRRDVDLTQRLASHAAYPAMNIGIVAAVNAVENPIGQRRAKVTVQFWHRARFDAASKSAAHKKVRSLSKFFYDTRRPAQ